MERKRVSKAEFEEFIKNYPNKLEVDVYAVSDPPLITYNDFSLAEKWPDSVVASTYKYDNNPDGYFYEPEENRIYRIKA